MNDNHNPPAPPAPPAPDPGPPPPPERHEVADEFRAQAQGADADPRNWDTSLTIAGELVYFSPIRGQEVCEGVEPWSFGVANSLQLPQNLTVTAWTVRQEQLTMGPELQDLQISGAGGIEADIPGAQGDQGVSGADEITRNHQYRLTVGATLASGLGRLATSFILTVTAAPEWDDVPQQNVTEFGEIFVALGSYVRNQPTVFSIRAQPGMPVDAERGQCPGTADPSAGPAFPELVVSALGNLTPSAAVTAPDCDDRYIYNVTVRAQNACGWSDKIIKVALNEKVPNLANYANNDGLKSNIFKEIEETAGNPNVTLDFAAMSQHNGDADGVRWGEPRCYELAVTLSDGYLLTGFDVPFTPSLELSSSTGELMLTNCPLVNPAVAFKERDRLFGKLRVFVRALNSNPESAASKESLTDGMIEVAAVAPDFDDAVVATITDTVTENAPFSFEIQRARAIGNYAVCHSQNDPTTYELINPPSGIGIDRNTGTISGTAPDVPGDETTTPSEPLSLTVSARNAAGADTATYTLTVDNVGAETGSSGISPWKARDMVDGRGILPDYVIDEGDVIDYPIGQYINDFTDDAFHWMFHSIHCPDPVEPVIVLETLGFNPPDRLTFYGSRYNARMRGLGTLVNAPSVDDRHVTCEVIVEIREVRNIPVTATFQGKFNLIIRQKAPVWRDFVLPDVKENQPIRLAIGQHCANDPVEYAISTGVALDANAPPPPNLAIDFEGNITAMDKAPDIQKPEAYYYTVTARNTLGYNTHAERLAHQQEDTIPLLLNVTETPPIYKENIPVHDIAEVSEFQIDLNAFVLNDPDGFALISVTSEAGAPEFPNIQLSLSGLLSGEAPLVAQDWNYAIVFRAWNSAGSGIFRMSM